MNAISPIPPQAAESGEGAGDHPYTAKSLLARAALLAARQVIARANLASRQPRTAQGRWYAQTQSNLQAWHKAGGFAAAGAEGADDTPMTHSSSCAVD